MAKQDCCCSTTNESPKKENSGLLSGILYGLLPHTFCIGFIVFSVLGVTLAAGVMRSVLLVPYFFQLLVAATIVLATVSAVIYLKRNGMLSVHGARRKWRYLTILYGTTIGVNVLLFTLIFPAVANMSVQPVSAKELSQPPAVVQTTQQQGSASQPAASGESSVTLAVNIPCAGHAPLISGELQGVAGVKSVSFKVPNLFTVSYDSTKTSLGQITALEVFQTYKAVVR